jgi:hypothetical protein
MAWSAASLASRPRSPLAPPTPADVAPPRPLGAPLRLATPSPTPSRTRRRRHLPAALSPTTPGPEIWVGAAIPTAVFALGAWEFTKRILIQRACPVCAGTGLVTMGGGGSPGSPARLVKCRACGGFFPWQSWARFFDSSPGNGGPLQQPTLPRQAGVLYRVPTPEEARAAARAAGVGGVGGESDAAGTGAAAEGGAGEE